VDVCVVEGKKDCVTSTAMLHVCAPRFDRLPVAAALGPHLATHTGWELSMGEQQVVLVPGPQLTGQQRAQLWIQLGAALE
jgi:hypothetical protein